MQYVKFNNIKSLQEPLMASQEVFSNSVYSNFVDDKQIRFNREFVCNLCVLLHQTARGCCFTRAEEDVSSGENFTVTIS